jgi:transporter, CPA2 family
LGVSIVGKGLACSVAAKVTGASNGDALAIGALMNSRGLMELILLNIGLQATVISPTMFTVFVIMAIVTTVMTTPLFKLAQRLSSVSCTPLSADYDPPPAICP